MYFDIPSSFFYLYKNNISIFRLILSKTVLYEKYSSFAKRCSMDKSSINAVIKRSSINGLFIHSFIYSVFRINRQMNTNTCEWEWDSLKKVRFEAQYISTSLVIFGWVQRRMRSICIQIGSNVLYWLWPIDHNCRKN